MPRGKPSPIGAERVSDNGYTYVKLEKRGWVLKHWLVAERILGRPVDPDTEMIRFKGSKHDFRETNIEIVSKGSTSLRRRIAQLNARIDELVAQRDALLKELESVE